jgi:ABC-type transport system involved in cytochrome c biogenesis permease subunit
MKNKTNKFEPPRRQEIKFEIRNSKFATNSNDRNSKHDWRFKLLRFEFRAFNIVSNFEFRISNLIYSICVFAVQIIFVLSMTIAFPSLARAAAPGASPWSADAIDALSRVPIQDQGRVKPLSTFAIFELVKINGRMTCTTPDGRRASAMEWLLDCFYRPQVARQYPNLLIESPATMQALGLSDAQKRARFRLADLEPHEDQLIKMAQEFSQIDEKSRTLFQSQILNLADVYMTYQGLCRAMDFARLREAAAAGSPMAGLLKASGVPPNAPGGSYRLRYSGLLASLSRLVAIYQAQVEALGKDKADHAEAAALLARLDQAAQNAEPLAIIAPVDDPKQAAWLSPGALPEALAHHDASATTVTATAAPQFTAALPRAMAAVAGLEALADAADAFNVAGRSEASETFDRAARRLADRLAGDAIRLGQYDHVPLEVFFYKARFFYWSLVFYVLAAMIVAAGWAAPRSRWMGRAGFLAVLAPTLVLWAGIAVRCVIRGRPPVTSLYETTLFVPAVAIAVALVAEWMTRRRIALSVAAALGCLGMFLAHNFELTGPDTMQAMIAVLNSNFWLSTHVTTVNIGYSASLLACALGHVYIVGQALCPAGKNAARRRDFFQDVTRLTYGAVCFGMFFIFLGTVLGGIWANDSWGRFWGWDPKENGVLLLILWFLFILHARLGGYIRDLGLAVCVVLGGIVGSFSWWGVNLLAIGLHSYGFISGAQGALRAYWLIELLVVAILAPLARARARAASGS